MIWQDISSLTGKRFSHWEAAFFADWSEKQCDYATNSVVHNFYNKEKAYWWRQSKFSKFIQVGDYLLPEEAAQILLAGQPIIVGLDKYALFGVSSNLVPKDILRAKYNDLMNDKVIRYVLKLENSKLTWTEI